MPSIWITIGFSCRQRLAGRLEATGHRNDLCVLDQASQHSVWRAPLRYRDLHARSVDLLRIGQRRARTCYIAVVDFHECLAEREMVGASGIPRCEADVPVIGREAFIVARGIVVRLEFDRNAKLHSQRTGNGDRHAAQSAIGTAGHQDGIRGDESGAELAAGSQYCDGRCGLRSCHSRRDLQQGSARNQTQKLPAGKFHGCPFPLAAFIR
jgi:hypothetical protein